MHAWTEVVDGVWLYRDSCNVYAVDFSLAAGA